MGVDFYGYSYVRSEPIPQKYRATVVPASDAERRQLEQELLSVPADLRATIMAMSGAQMGPSGLILPGKISAELRDEYYELVEKDDNYITLDWNTNTVYYKTPETKQEMAGRSYSGYADFVQETTRLNKGVLPYMPPSTDVAPENGIVSADKCMLCLQGLEAVRQYYVLPDWTPAAGKISPHDTKNLVHQDSWFFSEFYLVMALGAQSGIVTIG